MDDIFLDDCEDEIGQESNLAKVAVLASANSVHAYSGLLDRLSQHFSISICPYDEDLDITDAELVIIHLSDEKFVEDLHLVKRIRTLRSMVPIVALSEAQDPMKIEIALENTVNELFSANVNHLIAKSKINSLIRDGRAAILVELQNKDLLETTRSLRKAYQDLKDETQARLVAEEERDLAQELSKLHRMNKEILDNLRDGFLIINKDLRVEETTSRACASIFGQEVGGKDIETAFNLAPEKSIFLKLAIEQLFDNMIPADVAVSLVPKKFETLNNRTIEAQFTPICDENGCPERLIMVASDISKIVEERHALAAKEKLNEVVIHIVNNMDHFQLFLNHYRKEVALLRRCDDIVLIKRTLHTMKGNSSVFKLDFISERIHKMENEIIKYNNEISHRHCSSRFALELEVMMRKFLDANKKAFRIDYDKEMPRNFTIDEQQLLELYSYAEYLDSNAIKKSYLRVLDEHKSIPISVHTNALESKVEELVKMLEKKIDFSVAGYDLRINAEKVELVLKNLVHLVRNACDHGIEPPSLRVAKGKDETGMIDLEFWKENSSLGIRLTDDGKGIDVDQLLNSAIKRGILSDEHAQTLKEREVLELVFADSVSTSENVSQVSGRGVGMGALKQAVQDADGEINIETQTDKGTSFTILLPKVF